ncbi:hypothetical protein ThrDRAFT_03676 [Frankia casuarinae]|uniref:Uncharacterized protein n=1 Tax=Frankia casuarinae (strain DSM 45818 / CECT 9043 / HFP020203 / CcI3) TaxID=106370 RepID=Q2JCA5_FRACC|nr:MULTISPECIES: hypothetical protein [Frankia]ABD11087.1 hypothetical protein Francci3_1711 [Frankia casuarinae]EYT90680.1 hypothetical protein ThrDRAFT_03676 [Frankia casuarinae]OFB39731.1 hypothetical protein Manayef4_20190 [Frankia sp. CgIM4]
MRMRRSRNGHRLPRERVLRIRRCAPPDTRSLRERARDVFLDARDALRMVLEDDIEAETRTECPAASELEVEVYTDELGEARARLITVLTDDGTADDARDVLAESLADLLDEWATTANADSTEIVFRQLPEHH